MFPPKKSDGGDKRPADKGGKPRPGPGAQHELHHPAQPGQPPAHPAAMTPQQFGPRPGQGMNPMEAMMHGLGDISQFAPPPPPPMAPTGPGGLPVGANLPSSDPGMDPNMGGSSLFKALTGMVDPYAGPPEGHGQLDPPPDLNTLLALLSLQKAGLAGPGGAMNSASGVMPDPTVPGQAEGLHPFNVIM